MASVEDQHVVYNDDDLDDDDDEEEESGPPQNEVVVDEDDDDDVDVEDDDDSTSSPPPVSNHSGTGEFTIAVVSGDSPKPLRINEFSFTPASTSTVEEKKPLAFDDSRKLFQRLWTDEDEIELLQGFLEYTRQRGGINSSSHHHDTTAFYDQIKSKLQLDFNKNQLVEKLRRLKKKYRNVVSKMGSGKEFVFKSSHDQATFDISCKIWSNAGPIIIRRPEEYGGFDDEDSQLNLNNANFIDHNPNFNPDGIDVKTSKSRKRSRAGAIKVEEKPPVFIQHYYPPILPMSSSPAAMPGPQVTVPPPPTATATVAAGGSIPSLIEETVRSCLSPIFKELLNNVANLNGSTSFGFGMTPLGFGNSGMKVDEKWRKQQMLELEVYSRRLELVQDQIKAQLEELRSTSH
ncbi:unnamed protein product [Withania somnifera]